MNMASFKFGFDFNSTTSTSAESSSNKDSSDAIKALNQNDQKKLGGPNSNESAPVTKINVDILLKKVNTSIDKWSSAAIHFQQRDFSSTLKRIENDEKPFDSMETDAIIISTIEGNETDIIPGKYEGGLKVWECSIDLCNYLAEQISSFHAQRKNQNNVADCNMKIDFVNDVEFALSDGGKTIELGCGHGLPGCLLLKEVVNMNRNGIYESQAVLPKIIFTDYNTFVLRDATLPNILLNCSILNNQEDIKMIQQLTELYAGDWLELSNKLSNDSQARFDLILASETTYTNSASKETAMWLLKHLKYDTGIGLISMKRYYFGVGGGSDAFCQACKTFGLTFELVREFNDGASNIRELWRVRLPSKS